MICPDLETQADWHDSDKTGICKTPAGCALISWYFQQNTSNVSLAPYKPVSKKRAWHVFFLTFSQHFCNRERTQSNSEQGGVGGCVVDPAATYGMYENMKSTKGI